MTAQLWLGGSSALTCGDTSLADRHMTVVPGYPRTGRGRVEGKGEGGILSLSFVEICDE